MFSVAVAFITKNIRSIATVTVCKRAACENVTYLAEGQPGVAEDQLSHSQTCLGIQSESDR